MKGLGGNLSAFRRLRGMPEQLMTPEQCRVLRYCSEWPHWLSLVELSMALEPDDVMTVPSLVRQGCWGAGGRSPIVQFVTAGPGFSLC
jgi:hypothetical protein